MSPLLLAALVVAVTVIFCWAVAQLIRWSMERTRLREEERRGGLIDFSRKRV